MDANSINFEHGVKIGDKKSHFTECDQQKSEIDGF